MDCKELLPEANQLYQSHPYSPIVHEIYASQNFDLPTLQTQKEPDCETKYHYNFDIFRYWLLHQYRLRDF